ncbi:hypothetical protein O1611_g2426 [Lasiodiplodia mahajangana]|uniref:Uncharacterized protein n=1 Tax=Lasiodiplodia mahajangana TaxID=1108764 RepID=A0ACC2JUJ4_9PEZI|nr:hypothetical protein O1611_g2426 [Lasiodiplodia mahajangana]
MTSAPETNLTGVDGDLGCGISETLDDGVTSPPPRQSDSDHTCSDSGVSQDAAAVHWEVVEQACQTIKKLSDWIYSPSLYEEEYPTFDLCDQETVEDLYSELCKRGLAGYFRFKLHKEWNIRTGILTLRPVETEIHKCCASLVLDALMDEIDRVTDAHLSLQPFRDNFEVYNSRRGFQIGEISSGKFPRLMKCPDGQIRYKDQRFPRFVIEIGYRQTQEQIRDSMVEYVINTPVDAFTVLAINIEYALPDVRISKDHFHQASVSLWTSKLGSQAIIVRTLARNRIFRKNNGEAVGGALSIPFELLLPLEEHSKIPQDAQPAELQLDFESLSEIVRMAEETQREFDTGYFPDTPEQTVTIVDEDEVVLSEEIVPASKSVRISPHWRDLSEKDSAVLSAKTVKITNLEGLVILLPEGSLYEHVSPALLDLENQVESQRQRNRAADAGSGTQSIGKALRAMSKSVKGYWQS